MCKLHKTAQYVCLLGQGPEPCDVMIVGEAPGRREDDSGTPFVGKAGQELDDMLEEANFNRKDVFITNAVSCRPPDNRKPTKGEIKQCNAWLKYQMAKVKPKYVLLLGATAYQSITGSTGITKARGQPFEQDGMIYLPTLHPASKLYNPENGPIIQSDIKLFREIVNEKGVPRERELNWKHVLNWDDFDEMIEALVGDVSYDLETTCLYPWQTHNDKGKEAPAHITQIGFGTADGEFIIPTPHIDGSPWKERDIKKMVSLITARLKKCFLITHNGKFDFLWMWVHYGERWHDFLDFDTMMAHYNIDENERHGLKELARKFCGAPNWDIDKKSKTTNRSMNQLGLYHAHDLYYTRRLYPILDKMLKKEPDTHRLFYEFTLPAIKLYTEAQYDGVFINIEKFDAAEKYLINEKNRAEKALKKYGEINWGSTQQLARLLFDDLDIDPVEKTRGGANSTSESVLKRIDHPAAGEILKFRAAKQQLSFFINGWKPFLHRIGDNYFLHPSFKLHGTVTGRPSCEDPNLQQVPRDTRIRSLIDAPPGWVLMEFDLEQIELKLVAEDSRDLEMMTSFRRGVDIHWRTMINELLRGGGGSYVEEITQTSELFLVQAGLSADGFGAKVLLSMLDHFQEGAESYELLQLCSEDWKDQKSRGEQWRTSKQRTQSILKGWLQNLAGEKVSQEKMRAVQQYISHTSSSQERGRNRLEKIEFGDAVSVLSRIGPSIATELQPNWKEGRKKAKAVGFGYVYGMWWKKFKMYARDNYDIVINDEEAQDSREAFFELYKLEDWHRRKKKLAQKKGYVSTWTGRRRRLPDAQLKGNDMFIKSRRSAAERQAVNSPIQGFAAEINIMAAIQVREEFSRQIVRVVGTIHDAILMWVKRGNEERVANRVLKIMQCPELFDLFEIELDVPITADCKIGAWSEGVSLKKWKESRK